MIILNALSDVLENMDKPEHGAVIKLVENFRLSSMRFIWNERYMICMILIVDCFRVYVFKVKFHMKVLIN